MSFRYASGIRKPGFNPLAAQTPAYTYDLYSWGQNATYGQLGLNNNTEYSSPKQVGSATYWASASAGTDHSIALKVDGTIWTFGQNQLGQLGLGNTTAEPFGISSPSQVGSLTNWAVVQGATQSCVAIKTDGTLWSWGNGNQGMLGLGNITSYSSPKQVGALTNWSKISARGQCYGAIKTDGTLWTWGSNGYGGQLGLGDIVSRSSPVQVGSLTNWLNISAGNYHMLAVTTTGELYAWGNNNSGRLGLGNTTNYSSPKQVGALTTWLNVSAGTYFNLAIKTDGTLWSWGQNGYGQLGLGNRTSYSSPKQVGALTTWKNLGTGSYFALVTNTSDQLWSR